MGNESLLWCAVIEQAFLDATSRPVSARKRRDIERNIERDEARHWLLYPNEDFTETCLMAGIDSSCVRQRAFDIARDGWQRPF